MPGEWAVSIKFNVPDGFSRLTFGLGTAVLLFCLFPVKLGSETLTLTTYYPAPYGGYAGLLTTGRTILARDGSSVGIGPSDLALPAPNGLAGNLDVNDIYLRARGRWVSQLPIIRTKIGGNVAQLSCASNETIVGAGCDGGWRFVWPPRTFTLGPWFPLGVQIGPWTIGIPEIRIAVLTTCGTEPSPDLTTMNFTYPNAPPAVTWINCVKNKGP